MGVGCAHQKVAIFFCASIVSLTVMADNESKYVVLNNSVIKTLKYLITRNSADVS